jgi:hypothetical protein
MDAALRAGPQHFFQKVRKNPNLYMLGFLQCWPTTLFEKSAQNPQFIYVRVFTMLAHSTF